MSPIARVCRIAGLLGTIVLGIASTVGSGGGEGDQGLSFCGTPIHDTSNAAELGVLREPESAHFTWATDNRDPLPVHFTQWFRADSSGVYVPIPGATSDEYILDPTIYTRDSGAHFKVQVTWRCANPLPPVELGPMVLAFAPGPIGWVDVDAQGQPTQPADATVAAGATAHFIAMAYGLNTYQWQRSNDSGTTWIDVPGATDWALDVVSVQTTDDGSLFRLRAQTFDTSTLTHITITSRSARLSVTGQTPGLAAALDVPSVSVGQGSTQNVTLTLTPSNGFTGTVSWVVNNLPAGMTLASGSVNVAGPPPVTQALSLGVDGSVFAASYSLMIAVSAASIPPQMLPLQVTVTGAPDFSLVARPSNIVLTPGGQAGGFDVTLTPLNNFTGAVRLSLSGVTTPPLTVTPDVPFTVPVGPTAPVTQHFSVAVDGTAPIPASYSFDVIASIGATLHTARVNVTTQQPVSGYIQVGSNPRISASDARTTNGAGYSARFDFGQGTFGIGLDSTAGQGVTLGMGSGPGPTFIFTNRSPTPLVIPAGALNVKFNGRYTHVRGGQLQVVLTMVAQTSAGGPEPIAIVNHTISDPQPTLSKTESNGATVTIHQADMFALDVELGMPQLTVPVGGSLVFWYVLEAHPASGGDSMDFTTAGGRLCLHLPIGTWDNNVGVPIDWCQ